MKFLIPEFIRLLKLILVFVATNAANERSFSAMRRVKSYVLRSMDQNRLKYMMIILLHKEINDALKMAQVANQFVHNKERR